MRWWLPHLHSSIGTARRTRCHAQCSQLRLPNPPPHVHNLTARRPCLCGPARLAPACTREPHPATARSPQQAIDVPPRLLAQFADLPAALTQARLLPAECGVAGALPLVRRGHLHPPPGHRLRPVPRDLTHHGPTVGTASGILEVSLEVVLDHLAARERIGRH